MLSPTGTGRLLAALKPAALPRLVLGHRSTHRIFLRNYSASPLPRLQHWQPLQDEASRDDSSHSLAAAEPSGGTATAAKKQLASDTTGASSNGGASRGQPRTVMSRTLSRRKKSQLQKKVLLRQAKQAQGAVSSPRAHGATPSDRGTVQEAIPSTPPTTIGKTPPPKAALRNALKSLGDDPRSDKWAESLPSMKTVQPDASFSFSASSIPFDQVTPSFPQPPIATLAHGLSRVLFNPGVHWLQHPRSQVYNYPRRLQSLVSPAEFNYDALPGYVTSSRDDQLWQLAEQNDARFVGSTSSMTSSLSQVYFMLNPKKKLNFGMLSSSYDVSSMADFSAGAKMPASIILRHRNGRYAIDSDKLDANEDDPDETILSDLGHVMEKFFVLEPEAFDRMLKKNSHLIDPEERSRREAYAFGKSHSLFTRSQLDCYSELLPGNGTFDIKTRAVVAVRQDRLNHANAAGYQIRHERGTFQSFEREHYDLIRTAYLKYQFQARIGHMDGIFCAFHNTQRVFGFEYIPLENMDEALFGSREEGDKVFKLSLAWFERILNDAAEVYPQRDIGITLWARGRSGRLLVFVYPHSDSAGTSIPKEYTLLQYANYNYLDGEIVDDQAVDIAAWVENNLGVDDAVERNRLEWSIFGQMTKVERNERTDAMFNRVRQQQLQVSQLMMPEAVREPAAKQAQPGAEDAADHLGSSAKTWAPTPGRKYRTAPSELVKKLRALAKDGWKHLESQQTPKEIVTVEPVQYRIERAARKAASGQPEVKGDGSTTQKD